MFVIYFSRCFVVLVGVCVLVFVLIFVLVLFFCLFFLVLVLVRVLSLLNTLSINQNNAVLKSLSYHLVFSPMAFAYPSPPPPPNYHTPLSLPLVFPLRL